MLELLNRYRHGLVLAPVVHALRQARLFDAIADGRPFVSAQVAQRIDVHEGYLAVALNMLVGFGWLEQNGEELRASPSLREHAGIPADVMELYEFPFHEYAGGRAGLSLRSWIERSLGGWHGAGRLADYLDGLLVIPLLLALRARARLPARHEPARKALRTEAVDAEVEALFTGKGWARGEAGGFELTPPGQALVDRIFIAAADASYKPMLRRLGTLLAGKPEQVFARDMHGRETHVDRALNVQGSGFQHEKFFAALDDLLIPVFDNEDFENQPRYIADMGCGDGALLHRVYRLVRERTRRGAALERHPLTLVAADFNAVALAEAERTLQGLPHLLVEADIGDPEGFVAALAQRGIHDPRQILHLRSFLDHDRPFRVPADSAAVTRRRAATRHGTYVDREGRCISRAEVVQSTFEHMQRWARATGDNGLLLLEVHCLPGSVTSQFLDESESLHFDAIHNFSGQYLLEAQDFLMCAAEAGLFPRAGTSKKFPERLPFTRITLNHFEKRDYLARYVRADDIGQLIDLEHSQDCEAARRGLADRLARDVLRSPRAQIAFEKEGRLIGAAFLCLSGGDAAGSLRIERVVVADTGSDLRTSVSEFAAVYLELACAADIPVDSERSDGPTPDSWRHLADEVRAAWCERPAIPSPADGEALLHNFGVRWLFTHLHAAGLMRRAGETYSKAELRNRLSVSPQYERYFDALLVNLHDHGFIELGEGITVLPPAQDAALRDIATELAQTRLLLAGAHPSCLGLLAFIAACMEHFGSILRGEIDPVETVFRDGSTELFREVFGRNEVAVHFNGILADIVERVARALATGKARDAPVRILEIGAGSGAATDAVLNVLAGARHGVEVHFTDVSPFFLRAHQKRLDPVPDWLRHETLDIEAPLQPQGFAEGSFDIVYASHVLHDTRSLTHAITQIRKLLAPSGVLIIDEYTRAKECLLFCGALLRGYWSFEDGERRLPGTCLSSVDQWRDVLQHNGFQVMDVFGLAKGASDESVLFCTQTQEAVADTRLSDSIESDIKAILGARRIGVFARDVSLRDMGFDSMELMEFKTQLNKRLGLRLSPTFLFDFQTCDAICRELEQRLASASPIRESGRTSASRAQMQPAFSTRKTDIAVIGMAGRFAEASNIDELWRHLVEGRTLIREVQRWDISRLGQREGSDEFCRHGSFLDGIDLFDHRFFNIAGSEAAEMDPQQRLFLEESWHALENAGCAGSLANRRCGVFAGCSQGDYRNVLGAEVSGQSFWGNAPSVTPARVSYFLDLKGPAIAIDTACSSSLVAIHSACQSLWTGEIDLAVAGGVFVQCTEQFYQQANRAGMMSVSGRCHTFDAAADGFVPGEGVGVVVLKRLEDALADGDYIYGVIAAAATNQDGSTNGITAPSGRSQSELIGGTYRKFGIDPGEIDLVEAHGTGTALGDPIEFEALTQAFRSQTARAHYCAIGSIKTNLGHLVTAAGVAGVIKVLLAMQNQKLPPSLNFTSPNPEIDFDDSPFYVNTHVRAWKKSPTRRRRAAVSSFSFSGTNAHVVVEDAPPSPLRPTTLPGYLIVLSARTQPELTQQVRNLHEFVRSRDGIELGAISRTLLEGRAHLPWRFACVIADGEELGRTLDEWLRTGRARNVHACAELPAVEPRPEQRCAWDTAIERVRARDSALVEHLLTLAKLYVLGCSSELALLMRNFGFQKLPLPGYPFTRKRCWVDLSPGRPHALLEPVDRPRGLFKVRTSGVIASLLDDHLVNGQRVLPAVVCLELAGEAARSMQNAPRGPGPTREFPLTIERVAWMAPLASAQGSIDVRIQLVEEQAGYRFRIDTADELTRCEGHVGWTRQPPPPRLDIDAFRKRLGDAPLSEPECYELLATMGVRYGDSFQGVRELSIGPGVALGRIRPRRPDAARPDDFTLPPVLADAAIQVALLGAAARSADRGLFVPYTLEAFHVHETCRGDEMWAVVRYQAAGATELRCDIEVCDGQGGVCWQIRGLRCRRIEASGFEASAFGRKGDSAGIEAPAVAAREETFVPQWRPSRPRRLPHANLNGRVLVIGGEAWQRDHVLRHVQEGLGEALTMDLARQDDIETIAARLSNLGSVRHVVWIAEAQRDFDVTGESLLSGQSVGSAFRFVKALLRLGYADRDLLWTAITSQCLTLFDDEVSNPTHASLHGFFGSMSQEHPSWHVRLLDVPAERWPEDAFEVDCASSGASLAFREGAWFEQVWVPCRLPANPPVAYRDGAVYVVIGGAGGIGEVWTRSVLADHDAQVVWLGRRPPDGPIQAALDRCAIPGRRAPVYLSADARDSASLQRARQQIWERFGKVDGLVHSAIELADQTLLSMDAVRFEAAFRAKADTCVRMAQVFADSNPDFVLFFSSVNSFARFGGQSNYVSGCTFTDHFAKQLSRQWRCAVKVVNWGYWGSTGVVSTDAYRRNMQAHGFDSIDPAAGMVALRALLGVPLSQLAVAKTFRHPDLNGVAILEDERITVEAPGAAFAPPRQHPATLRAAEAAIALHDGSDSAADEALAALLWSRLETMLASARATLHAAYARWWDESLRILAARGYLRRNGDEITAVLRRTRFEDAWTRLRAVWAGTPNEPRLALLQRTITQLPLILRSSPLAATDAIFGDPSLDLVAAVYQDNPQADCFTNLLADGLLAQVEAQTARDPRSRIAILEVGAGIGSATRPILDRLAPFAHRIGEYCYTDVSNAFLRHAEERFRSALPRVEYKLFNVETAGDRVEVPDGHFDYIVASNVLHATCSLRRTLSNLRRLLKPGGALALNELSTRSLFHHLTFGMLPGWWAYQDDGLRMGGSPAAALSTWKNVLGERGFSPVVEIGAEWSRLGQQVLLARHDGVMWHPRVAARRAEPPRRASTPPAELSRVTNADLLELGQASPQQVTERIKGHFARLVAGTLKIDAAELDAAFAQPRACFLGQFGVDSLFAAKLRTALRRGLKVEVSMESLIAEDVETIVGRIRQQLLVHGIAAAEPGRSEEVETFVF